MHQKASSYIGHGAEKQNEERNREPDAPRGGNSGAAQDSRKQEPEENPAPEKSQDSTFILLILLILLSQGETADKLLLALLYLLF